LRLASPPRASQPVFEIKEQQQTVMKPHFTVANAAPEAVPKPAFVIKTQQVVSAALWCRPRRCLMRRFRDAALALVPLRTQAS
jgi:hypothetical protein